MALVVADRIQETSITAGTGTLSLSGAVAGNQSFVSGVGSGNTTYYAFYDQAAQVWEVGIGTVTAGSPDTLSRTTILANSSGTTSPLSLAGNAITVWCDYPAEKAVFRDASGNVTLGGALNVTGTTTLATSLTGLLKTASGVVSNATSGTDYAPATSGTAILKGNGTGGFSSATAGTDYSAGTSALTTGILKSTTSTGALSIASAGTDYAPATSGSSILYGNGSGGFSNVTIGSGVSFSGGTLSATGAGGTVTAVSVASANGFAGTSSGGTTPALTISTSISGVLKGNGTAISSAAAGTDYVAPGGALGTPSSGTLTNCSGLPISTGVSGLGTGVATALAVAVGSSGAPVVNGGVLGTPSSGTLSNCTADGTDAVGFRNIPQNVQTGNYTLVAADSGKHIYRGSGTAATWTIPANGSVAYAIGTALTFINFSSTAVSIGITTDTMYLAGSGSTGTRTLAQYGTATAVKIAAQAWVISGAGLT